MSEQHGNLATRLLWTDLDKRVPTNADVVRQQPGGVAPVCGEAWTSMSAAEKSVMHLPPCPGGGRRARDTQPAFRAQGTTDHGDSRGQQTCWKWTQHAGAACSMVLEVAHIYRALVEGNPFCIQLTYVYSHTMETIQVVGSLDVDVKYKAQEAQRHSCHSCMVVAGEGPTLLGRNWLETLQLDWQNLHYLHGDGPLQQLVAIKTSQHL